MLSVGSTLTLQESTSGLGESTLDIQESTSEAKLQKMNFIHIAIV